MLRLPPSVTTFLLLGLLPPALLAQTTRPGGATPATTAASGSASAAASTEEAQRRYARALELFNEGSYDAALLEFRRAYQLAPSWKILYNIGQVNVQLNDYANALDAFERYLSEGGAEVPAVRNTEIKGQIERLRARVAQLDITSNVPGTEIAIDDLPVGKTPLARPIRVNVGRRKVALTAVGYLPQNRVVEAAGGDKVKLEFQLVTPEAMVVPSVVPTTSGTAPPPPPPPSSHIFWPGWIAAGALGVGATVTGILALGAKSDFNDKRDQFGVKSGDLDDAHKKVTRLNVTTDILLGAAVLTGGVSLYLSLRSPGPSATASTSATSLGLRVGPSALHLQGSF